MAKFDTQEWLAKFQSWMRHKKGSEQREGIAMWGFPKRKGTEVHVRARGRDGEWFLFIFNHSARLLSKTPESADQHRRETR